MEFPMHWLVILVVVLILFGGRKIPELMRGLGEGVRGFKDGMSGATHAGQATPAQVSAPTGITARPGRAQVAISWNASPGANSYNVKRSGTSGGPYALIASTAATSHSDEGLASGTYYYVVTAISSYGESAHSVEVSGTVA
jgi:cellulose 1,4-beta-cellobiosidase